MQSIQILLNKTHDFRTPHNIEFQKTIIIIIEPLSASHTIFGFKKSFVQHRYSALNKVALKQFIERSKIQNPYIVECLQWFASKSILRCVHTHKKTRRRPPMPLGFFGRKGTLKAKSGFKAVATEGEPSHLTVPFSLLKFTS